MTAERRGLRRGWCARPDFGQKDLSLTCVHLTWIHAGELIVRPDFGSRQKRDKVFRFSMFFGDRPVTDNAMKETRQESIERLRLSALFAGCLFMSFGINTILSQHYQRASPGIGVWMNINGNQAVLTGLCMVAMGAVAGWLFYFGRASNIFPNWKRRLEFAAVALTSIMLFANTMLFTSKLGDALRMGVFVSCMMFVAIGSFCIHGTLKKRINNEKANKGMHPIEYK